MRTDALEGGFAQPATDAAHAFRAVLEAMARPGTIHTILGAAPPAPISPAAGAVLLTLCDAQTPVHLAGQADCAALRTWLAFHTGAPLTGPSKCMFALGTWNDLGALDAYPVGSSDYPDRSATLIVETDLLDASGATLNGPGIRERALLSLPETEAFRKNAALYPLGLDFIFTCGDRVAALPRSTEVR
jgi:alpha-D-ribose 1-methylphosphonate 5-triphosphate synthase subunit PhnH